MKKFLFFVFCITLALLAYICNTKGRGEYIPTQARPYAVRIYEKYTSIVNFDGTGMTKTIHYSSNRSLLSKLQMTKTGQKIVLDPPFNPSVNPGNNGGALRNEIDRQVIYDIQTELRRIRGN